MLKEAKGINPIISAVFVLAITVVGVGLVLNIGMPALERSRETTVFDEARGNLNLLENTIDTVRLGDEGASRTITLDVTDGRYLVNETDDTVRFKNEIGTDFLPPALCRHEGNVLTRTFGDGRVLDLRFNDNKTADCSIYENHGEVHGATWIKTIYGTALSFGEEDHVNVTDFTQENKTVSIWAKEEGENNWEHHINNETFYSVEGDVVMIGKDFEGEIESFRIYNRILSDEEIQTLSNRGNPGPVEELEIKLSPGGVDITESLQLGTGRHNLLVRNEGYDERTEIKIEEI